MFYSTYSFFCETAITYGPYCIQNLTTLMDITAILRIRTHLQHSPCVSNVTSRDEDIQGGEGKIPQILNLGTEGGGGSSFLRCFTPSTHWILRTGRPRAGSHALQKRKVPCCCH